MLNKAKELIENKKYEEALAILSELLDTYPNDAEINYQAASAYDAQGDERAAIPLYEKALALNIAGDQRAETFIQLGSSYRCIGEYRKAKQVLSKGLEQFPDNPALEIFLAMTLYNLGEAKSALTLLLKRVTKSAGDPWVTKYERAIAFYTENLDETW